MESLKRGRAKLNVKDGSLQVTIGKSTSDVKAASIEDIFTGSETTQAGGNVGSAAKVGALAGPPGTGAALTLLLRTKVDVLTVVYRGPEGGLHGALFAVPKGTAVQIRDQLVAAGAKTSERNGQ